MNSTPQWLMCLLTLWGGMSWNATAIASPAARTAMHHSGGIRPNQFWSASDMSAGVQNFDVIQAPDGVMLMGNLFGIVTFDGANWQLEPLPNDSAVTSLSFAHDGTILAGGFNAIGRIFRDGFQRTQFFSLLETLDPPDRSCGLLKTILVADDVTYLQTEMSVFAFQNGTLRRLNALKSNASYFLYQGALAGYDEHGWLVGDPLITPPFPAPSEKAFKTLPELGLLTDSGQLIPFNTTISLDLISQEWLAGNRLTDLCRLRSGDYAIASRDRGVLLLDDRGIARERLNRDTGLKENDVRGLCQSEEGALWLAMDQGIHRVDITSNLFVYDETIGLHQTVLTIAKHEGQLFLGTNSGLLTLPGMTDPKDPPAEGTVGRWSPIAFEGKGVWDLMSLDDGLLLVSNEGLGLFRNGTTTLVPGSAGHVLYVVQRSTLRPDTLWVGGQEGLFLLEKQANAWHCFGPLPGTPPQVRSIEEGDHGTLWLGTTFDGLWSVPQALASFSTSVSGSVPSQQWLSGEVELFPFEGNLGASHKGIAYRLTSLPAPQVIPEVRLNQLLGIHGFFDLHRDALGRYWLNSRPLILLHPESGNFRLDDFTLRNLPGSGFLGFFVDEGGCVWLSNDEGLFQLFPEMPGQDTQMRPPAFSRFSYGDQWLAPQSLGVDLPYNLGKFRFDFAPLTFEPNPQFQFRLDPVDTEWSTWTEQAFTEFPRLWEGRYTFRLRTRYPQGEVSPEALLSFRVRPPWFRSYGAFLGYFLGGTALIGLFLRWRTLKLRYQARSLQLQVEERTAALADSLEQLQATQRELVEKNLALEDANRQLKQLSMKDGLTGVANRRRLDQFLEEEGRRAVRTGHPLSMILLDLDFFKKLNDALGHVQGDQTLIGVAAYLKQVDLRGGDLVARYGGEEFAIVLPQCPLEMALQLAEKIRLGIEGLALPHPESPWNVVTASLGVGTLKNAREVAPTELIRLADHALYQSKTTGRNRVSSLTPWEEAAGPDSPPAAE